MMILITHNQPPPSIPFTTKHLEFRCNRKLYTAEVWYQMDRGTKVFCAVVVRKTTGLVDMDAYLPAGSGIGAPIIQE